MKIQLKDFPYNNDCALAITLDDLHPESVNDKKRLDYGFDMKGQLWKRLNALSKQVPAIKYTLFTVSDWREYTDMPQGLFAPLRKVFRVRHSYPQSTFTLSHKKYTRWISQINALVNKGMIEISFHGLNHFNPDVRYAAGQEFLGIPTSEVSKKLKEMQRIFSQSGIIFKKGFRCPGWGCSDNLIRELVREKMLYIACSSDFKSPVSENVSKGAGLKHQPLFNARYVSSNCIGFTANCFSNQTQRAVDIARKNGIVVVHGHVAPVIFGIKTVDEHFQKNVSTMVGEIKRQTLQRIWFASLGELAQFSIAKKSVIYKVMSESAVRFTNNSKYRLMGLTIRIGDAQYILPMIPPHSSRMLNTEKHKKEKVKVSVILTVYNGQATIKQSLQSLCDQTYQNLEIIIVNDGSTDNTKKILNTFVKKQGDERIKILNLKNMGRSFALKKSFKYITGSIVSLCEDDALYDKDYITYAVRHLIDSRKKVGGVIGPHYVWNRNESFNTRVKDIERRRNFIDYCPKTAWIFRRNVFEEFWNQNTTTNQVDDAEFGNRILHEGYRLVYEPKCRWLHKEPASIVHYLRRKFKGGVGMALLKKMGIKKTIIPPPYLLIPALLLTPSIFLILYKPNIIFFYIILSVACLFAIRIPDIKKTVGLTNEPLWFIVAAVLYEYTWWAATLCGYLYGMSLSKEQINRYLKGR